MNALKRLREFRELTPEQQHQVKREARRRRIGRSNRDLLFYFAFGVAIGFIAWPVSL